ncbi:hypothetical protein T492DRAFT_1134538 [Pavlovales sp. CCMP2436]|nr:hypothetical protein T492DRAFT_1134538 [Pavlovales sp. CCMP2436]
MCRLQMLLGSSGSSDFFKSGESTTSIIRLSFKPGQFLGPLRQHIGRNLKADLDEILQQATAEQAVDDPRSSKHTLGKVAASVRMTLALGSAMQQNKSRGSLERRAAGPTKVLNTMFSLAGTPVWRLCYKAICKNTVSPVASTRRLGSSEKSMAAPPPLSSKAAELLKAGLREAEDAANIARVEAESERAEFRRCASFYCILF